MNWAYELCDLYDKNKEIAGKMEYLIYKTKKGEERIPCVLLPLFHTTVKAQITVTVDENGNFLRAEQVPNEDRLTIIPVTENSASRTTRAEPHPLCDVLKYIAGDYMQYYENKKEKKGKDDYSQNYLLYIEALEKWKQSPYTHEKVNAIYWYLKKKSLVEDLVREGILKLNEKEKLMETEKIQGISEEDVFVRFRVEAAREEQDILSDTTGKFYPECWLDRTLQQKFIEYYQSLCTEVGMSYLTGEIQPISFLHPKKIRNEGDNAKLISANDNTYFTFRGRFSNKEEAFSIGYENSQKVHNALKWIIRKQGYSWDSLSIVIWESDLLPIPDFGADTDSICESQHEQLDEEEQESTYAGTNEAGAANFRKALHGYGKKFGNMSKVVLLSFDAATTGRLAMTEYKLFSSARYLDNIQYWHETCEWIHKKWKDKKRYSYYGMVGIKEITEVLYGTEQNGKLSLNGKTKMYAEVCKRLLPCISDRKNIPLDMVNLAIQKASSPISYKEFYNWEQVLSVACSFVKKYRNELYKEVWKVALDKECKERDYLYGRLLAVADRIEYLTYSKEDNRETNAKRYMNVFSQRPFQTWKVIEEKIQPYLQRLELGGKIHYSNLLDEIFQMFKVDNFQDNSKLNGLYLLGFHSQSAEFKEKEKKA